MLFLTSSVGQMLNTQLEEEFAALIIGIDVKGHSKRNGWILPMLDDFMLQSIFGKGADLNKKFFDTFNFCDSSVDDLRSSQLDDEL